MCEYLPVVRFVVLRWATSSSISARIKNASIVGKSPLLCWTLAWNLSADDDLWRFELIYACRPKLVLIRGDRLGKKRVLDLSTELLQVSDHWQDVDDEKTRYGTYQSENTSNLGVENRDECWDQEYCDIEWIKYSICDFLIFEK